MKGLEKKVDPAPPLAEEEIPTLPDEYVEDIVAGDEAADRFFSAPPKPPALESEPAPVVEDAARPEMPARTALSGERRRYLMRYVASAVAVSGVICIAAVVHATNPGEDSHSLNVLRVPSRSTTVAAAPAPAAPEVAPAAEESKGASPEPAPPPTPPVASATNEAPGNGAPAEAKDKPSTTNIRTIAVEELPRAQTAAPPPPSPVPVAAAPEKTVDPQAALEAKQESQKAIDRGDMKLSIETGERSVSLDPTDAEAWLILGAAYLQKGIPAQARRCFSSCVQLAKRGPRAECAALLR